MINPHAVRLAAPDDEHDLMAMLRFMHDESPLRTVDGRPLFFSDAKARAAIRKALNTENGGRTSWVGILGERGHLQGSVCLSIIEPSPLSHETFLGATWNYILAEFRQTTEAKKTLMDFCKDVQRALRIPLLIEDMGQHKGRRSFYERAGCQPFGGVLLYSALNDSAAGA